MSGISRKALATSWLSVATALMMALSLGSLRAASKDQGKGSKPQTSGWSDDFSGGALNTRFWVVANGQAPGYIPCTHFGDYDPGNVSLQGGYLVLTLNQQDGLVDGCNGVVSHGALIYTRKTYGYGTYEWTMRMSSTASSPGGPGSPTSGSTSAGFIYVNNSQTEIDFEFPGVSGDTLYMVNWLNTNPSADPTGNQETFSTVSGLSVASAFHTYKFVWQPGEIDYCVDGALESVHQANVPISAAQFMINHWGTDNPSGWGGSSTLYTPRYFYIDSVSYAPLP